MKIFEIVDQTVTLFNQNIDEYARIERIVNDFLISIVESNENYIGSASRVKNENSLRSKIIKRKYYLEYDQASDIINNLSDIIGVTLECRFKEDEVKLFNQIKHAFIESDDEFLQSKENPNLYLNLNCPQPQKQSNGYDIFRIDGYYLYNNERVNFELQIKSLINTFWSGIEHEVIYKNNNYLMFDSFLKEMLTAVKNNLDTIDAQLTQIYTEMTHKGNDSIGMDGTNFKAFLGKEINNLFAFKLKETAEIDIDIKKISALLSHYLYLEEFVRSDSPQIVMLEYFEKLDLLSKTDMDFTVKIDIEEEISNGDEFKSIFGQYCLWAMNIDFDWHVLFSMLFMMQDDDLVLKFNNFINFIKNLLFSPGWFKESVAIISQADGCENIESDLYTIVATNLVNQKSVSIVYEENLYHVMVLIREFVKEVKNKIENKENINIKEMYTKLGSDINKIFINCQ